MKRSNALGWLAGAVVAATAVIVLAFLYPGPVTALVQMATLVAILVYVSATNRMAQATRDGAKASEAAVEEMRQARDLETRPYVLLRPHVALDGSICLLLRNYGRSAAFDVTFATDPPIRSSDTRIKGLDNLLTHGLSYLPPDQQMSLLWGDMRELMAQHPAPSSVVTLRYRGGVGDAERCETFTICLEELRGVLFHSQEPLLNIAHEIHTLGEAVGRQRRGHGGLSSQAH